MLRVGSHCHPRNAAHHAAIARTFFYDGDAQILKLLGSLALARLQVVPLFLPPLDLDAALLFLLAKLVFSGNLFLVLLLLVRFLLRYSLLLARNPLLFPQYLVLFTFFPTLFFPFSSSFFSLLPLQCGKVGYTYASISKRFLQRGGV